MGHRIKDCNDSKGKGKLRFAKGQGCLAPGET